MSDDYAKFEKFSSYSIYSSHKFKFNKNQKLFEMEKPGNLLIFDKVNERSQLALI